jgi:hypothetical protein
MAEKSNTTTSLRALSAKKRRRGQRMTAEERDQAKQKFLDSFKLNANLTLASMQAGVDRSQIYRWQEHDDQFAAAFREAELAANDMLLAAAWQRAVKGVEKPVVSMGKQVYVDGKPLMERVYSDTVLLRLMSWRIPGFSEKTQVEHSGQIDIAGSQQSLLAKLQSMAQENKAE